MAALRKYGDELRERATRMAVEARRDPATRAGAIKRVAGPARDASRDVAELGSAGRIDGGVRVGTTSGDVKRLVELERDNRELRRANEILRTASAVFAAAKLGRKIK